MYEIPQENARREVVKLKDRVAALEHELSEVLGCVEEYVAAPCGRIKTRLIGAYIRAHAVLNTKKG